MNGSFNFPSRPQSLFSSNPSSSPCSPAMAAAATAATAADPRFHVLVVDDSLTDRKLAERLLKNSSYRVTAVDSVSRALEFLGLFDQQGSSTALISPEMDVSLIITDYSMPGMTGYDLLKKIKESSILKDIPVVIMSSENLPSRISRCLEEGADEFFLKPVQLSDMQKLRPHILKGKTKEGSSSSSNSSRRKFSNDNVLPEWIRIRLPLTV